MLDSILKVSMILGLALAASGLLRARSAAVRHWVLAAALGCAVAVPALELFVPAWDLPLSRTAVRDQPGPRFTVPPEGSATSPMAVASFEWAAQSATPPSATSRAAIATTLKWICGVWMLGAGSSLAVLLIGLWRLARLASSARPVESARWRAIAKVVAREYGVRRPIRLLVSDRPALLVTWGHRRPIVLVPSSAELWSDDRVLVVLSHEVAHIQRHDWLTSMLGEMLRAVYWFNPLVWIACRRMRLESEQACDDAVLTRGVEGSAYASHLLDVARSFRRHRHGWLPAPAMVRVTSLERRIGAMLNPRLNRRPMTAAARIATVATALALATGVAGFRIAAQTFGNVSGSVVDATNRTISGATLVLAGAPNQAKHELHSDADGHFEFVGLPQGAYRLEASVPGFATFRTELVVGARPLQQVVALQVGSLMETITVSGVDARPRHDFVEPVPQLSSGCVGTAAGGTIEPPTKLRDVRPNYPALLYETKVEGHVVLDARIGTDGAIGELRVITPAHPDLDAAALEAVRQWRFSQTRLNCVPIEVSMTVHVNFVPRP